MTDIEKMSGKFELGENEGDTAVLTGMAPVSEMREYQKDVAAYTGGTDALFCTMAVTFRVIIQRKYWKKHFMIRSGI